MMQEVRSELARELLAAASKPMAHGHLDGLEGWKGGGEDVQYHDRELEALERALGNLGRVQSMLRPLANDPEGGALSPKDLATARQRLTEITACDAALFGDVVARARQLRDGGAALRGPRTEACAKRLAGPVQ